MTDRPGGHRSAADQPADPGLDVRAGLERTVSHLPPVGDLVPEVSRRARRMRRRRMVVGSGAAAAAMAVVISVAAALTTSSAERDRTPAVIGDNASATSPAPASPSVPQDSAASGTPSVSPPVGNTNSVAPSTWGPVRVADEFTAATLDRSLWTIVYSGPAGHPLGSWSPSDVAVGGDALRLSISRPAGARPPSTSGAVAARTSVQRYGRWEVRWRMTPGRGVLGQFALSSEVGGTPPSIVVNLSPSSGTVEVTGTGVGTAAGATATVGRADEYHTIAVEWSPQRLRFLLNGTTFAESTTGVPNVVLWPALQTMLAGPDCGATPLPAGCNGTRTPFPQRLDVDWFHVQPYRG
jgi:hypothetical protein